MFQHFENGPKIINRYVTVFRQTQPLVIYSKLEIVRRENRNTNQNQLGQSWLYLSIIMIKNCLFSLFVKLKMQIRKMFS